MAVGQSTYTFARPVPYLLVRGSAQTCSAPIRHGAEGALVAPTEAGSTLTVTKPDGTYLVSAGAVTVTGSIATKSVTPTAVDPLGAGWLMTWSLVIGGDTYVFRTTAYICEYVPPPVVSAIDLLQRVPELRYRVPAAQSTDRGDGTGWQPQIDDTYYELLQRLIDDGRRPWEIVEVTGYREWCIARTIQRCIQTIPAQPDSPWAQAAVTWAHETRRAEAAMRFRYSSEDSSTRKGGSPLIRLCPVGRPSW